MNGSRLCSTVSAELCFWLIFIARALLRPKLYAVVHDCTPPHVARTSIKQETRSNEPIVHGSSAGLQFRVLRCREFVPIGVAILKPGFGNPTHL